MCNIDNCKEPARAKGLCAKHYARQRRYGNALRVNPPGRKSDTYLSITREMYPEWSKRTQAMYAAAWRRFNVIEQKFGGNGIMYALKEATRDKQSGKLNVARLHQESIKEAQRMLSLMEQ